MTVWITRSGKRLGFETHLHRGCRRSLYPTASRGSFGTPSDRLRCHGYQGWGYDGYIVGWYIGIYIYIICLFIYVCVYICIFVWYDSSNVQYGYPHVFPILLFMENMFFQPMDEWGTRCSDILSAGQKKNADAYNVRPPSYKLVYKPQ